MLNSGIVCVGSGWWVCSIIKLLYDDVYCNVLVNSTIITMATRVIIMMHPADEVYTAQPLKVHRI